VVDYPTCSIGRVVQSDRSVAELELTYKPEVVVEKINKQLQTETGFS